MAAFLESSVDNSCTDVIAGWLTGRHRHPNVICPMGQKLIDYYLVMDGVEGCCGNVSDNRLS